MIYTKYLRSCGHIVGQKTITDDVANHETDQIGFIEGNYDAATFYVTPLGVAAVRTRATGLSVSKTTFVADGVDSVTVSGLPVDCWIRVNASLVHVVDGSYTLISSDDDQQYRLELVGQYYATAVLTINAITTGDDLIRANSRWQQIMEATPEQVQTWANNNITDLASARNVLVSLILVVRRLYEKSQPR